MQLRKGNAHPELAVVAALRAKGARHAGAQRFYSCLG